MGDPIILPEVDRRHLGDGTSKRPGRVVRGKGNSVVAEPSARPPWPTLPLAMSEDALEKAVWTDGDFDRMRWHDATVHAIAFHEDDQDAELLLDIDYIVRWIDPEPPAEHFTFLVAPATLVFENVWYLDGELGTASRTLLQILDIHRHEPENDRQREMGLRSWVIEWSQGHELTFLASGFRQHFRAHPMKSAFQRLDLGERAASRSSSRRPSRLSRGHLEAVVRGNRNSVVAEATSRRDAARLGQRAGMSPE